MDLAQLASNVASRPSLHTISLEQLLLFLAIASSMQDNLLLIQPSEHAPTVAPVILPPSAERFIASACRIPLPAAQDCWMVFKDVLWQTHSPSRISDSILQARPAVFDDHGLPSGFSMLITQSELPVLADCAP